MRTYGHDFKVGDKVRVSGHGWCDAPGVIQAISINGFFALVLRDGGNSPAWIPLTSITPQ